MAKKINILKHLLFGLIAFIVFTILTQLALVLIEAADIKIGFIKIAFIFICFIVSRTVYRYLVNPSRYKKLDEENQKTSLNKTISKLDQQEILDAFPLEVNEETVKKENVDYSEYRKKDFKLFIQLFLNTACCFIITFPIFYYLDELELYLEVYPYIFGGWIVLFWIYVFNLKPEKYTVSRS